MNSSINQVDLDGRGEEPFDTGFRIVVSGGVLYVTMRVQAFSHSLFGVPQRPGKTALESEGPGAGLTSDQTQVKKDSARFRVLLAAFMRNDLSERCRKYLEKVGISVGDISEKAQRTDFWDVSFYGSSPVAELPGVSGTFARPTLGELLHPWAAATVVRNQQGRLFGHVVFGRAFSRGLDVFHEMVHIVTQQGDVDLAKRWHLGEFNDDPKGSAQASQAITQFFDPNGWDCGANVGWPAP